MERSTPMSASRVQLTPLHNYEDDDGGAKPALTVDELWTQAHREMDSMILALDSTVESDNSLDTIRAIELLADDFTAVKLERGKKVKDSLDRVYDLQQRVEEAREEAEPNLPAPVREQRIQELSDKNKAMVGSILRNSQLTDDMRKKLEELATESESLKKRIDTLKKEDDEELSFRAYLLSIITKVTATSMAPIQRENQDIHGIVSGASSYVPFNIEERDVGSYDSVNYLWSLITGDGTVQPISGK